MKKLIISLLIIIGIYFITDIAFAGSIDFSAIYNGHEKITNSVGLKMRIKNSNGLYLFVSNETLQDEENGLKLPEFNIVSAGCGYEKKFKYFSFFGEIGLYVPAGERKLTWDKDWELILSQLQHINKITPPYKYRHYSHWEYTKHELNKGIGAEFGMRKTFELCKRIGVGVEISYRYLVLENHLEAHSYKFEGLENIDAWWEVDYDSDFSSLRAGVFLRIKI